MPSGIGYGASQGLESVLARMFQESQAKQQALAQQRAFDLQQQQLAERQSEFDQSQGLEQRKFDAEMADREAARQPRATRYTMNGRIIEVAPDGTSRTVYEDQQAIKDQAAQAAADAAWKGTELANQNNQKELDRQNALKLAGINHPNAGAPAAAQSSYVDETSNRTLAAVKNLKNQVNNWTAGMGSTLASIPGSQARNFKAQLDTLKANIAFGELTKMREASKTGGALGQVSDREEQLLSSVLGSLDPGQSPDVLRGQLQQIEDSLTRFHQAQQGAGLGLSTIQPTSAPSAAPRTGGVRRYNPATGQVE